MAIWQASCELEIVPSLHSNLAGAASATGGGMAGAAACWGAGACATDFWKSAQPVHENEINKARADRTCVASGDTSSGRQGGFVSANPPACGHCSIQRPSMIRTYAGRCDGGEGVGNPANQVCGIYRGRYREVDHDCDQSRHRRKRKLC